MHCCLSFRGYMESQSGVSDWGGKGCQVPGTQDNRGALVNLFHLYTCKIMSIWYHLLQSKRSCVETPPQKKLIYIFTFFMFSVWFSFKRLDIFQLLRYMYNQHVANFYTTKAFLGLLGFIKVFAGIKVFVLFVTKNDTNRIYFFYNNARIVKSDVKINNIKV